jgi:hypothetical protein
VIESDVIEALEQKRSGLGEIGRRKRKRKWKRREGKGDFKSSVRGLSRVAKRRTHAGICRNANRVMEIEPIGNQKNGESGRIVISKLSIEKDEWIKEIWQEAKNTINTRNPTP